MLSLSRFRSCLGALKGLDTTRHHGAGFSEQEEKDVNAMPFRLKFISKIEE